MIKRKKFYSEGIRFSCQDCGKCCLSRERYSFVYISMGDRKRLADHLRISTKEFTIQYTSKTDGHLHLKYPEKDCLFLSEGRCSVYEARPSQCRSWPFWPENMKKGVWEKELKTYCPGIGQGRLYSESEIEEIVKREKELFNY
ncbi:MAG: YkgJ family cysteine cluster protein [Nitrospirota bacterium]|nr:MAG: YkgJ family cysteine cluster protein [Nitrospirota bacterium]